MGVDNWRLKYGGAMREKRFDPFPTEYSKTKESEFFAEMFAGYIEGTLNAKQRTDFDPIIRDLQRHSEPTTGLSIGRKHQRRRRHS